MTTNEHCLRRVALLVASLDHETADQLLDEFPPDRAQAVRDALLTLDAIDEVEQSAVIREFIGADHAVASTDARSGTERRLFVSSRPRALHDPRKTSTGDDLKDRSIESGSDTNPLERASERVIAECLGDELPQAIAVALAQLPTQRASEVVAHLSNTLQAQVLERLVEFDPAHSVDAPEIRDEFDQWLNEQIERSLHRAELAARLATILDATHSGTRQRILHNVSNSDARLAKEIQHQLTAIGASPD